MSRIITTYHFRFPFFPLDNFVKKMHLFETYVCLYLYNFSQYRYKFISILWLYLYLIDEVLSQVTSVNE